MERIVRVAACYDRGWRTASRAPVQGEGAGDQVDDTERNTQVQRLAADLFEVSGAMRRDGEAIARQAGQTQARWQVMWIASTGQLTVPSIARRLGITRQRPARGRRAREGSAGQLPAQPRPQPLPPLVLTSRGAAILDQLQPDRSTQERGACPATQGPRIQQPRTPPRPGPPHPPDPQRRPPRRPLPSAQPNPRLDTAAAAAAFHHRRRITDEATPLALRSTRNHPRRAMHYACVRSRRCRRGRGAAGWFLRGGAV